MTPSPPPSIGSRLMDVIFGKKDAPETHEREVAHESQVDPMMPSPPRSIGSRLLDVIFGEKGTSEEADRARDDHG